MAEALLRARLAERGIEGVSVGSVGMMFDDRPAEDGAIAAMAKRGLDIGDHRARTLHPDALDRADLLVAMEARHLHELANVGVEPNRAFTFPDLVARAEQIGSRGPQEALADWIRRLSLGRPTAGWIVVAPASEVTDPMGGSRRAFRKCADVLADLVDRFTAVAWPNPTEADHSPVVESWSN